ncbi:MAG: ATP-binding protein [Chloroflexota bacterium]
MSRTPEPPPEQARQQVRARPVTSTVARDRITDVLFRTALDAIVGIDINGRITTWNPAAERLFGWTAQEALGADLAELLIPTRMQGAHEKAVSAYLRTGIGRVMGRRVELPARRKRGGAILVEVSLADTSDTGRRELFAFMRDITEARLKDTRLAEVARLPDENPSPVLRVAWNGEVLYANPSGQKLAPRLLVPRDWRHTIAAAIESGERSELVAVNGGRVFSLTVTPVTEARYANLYGRDVTDQGIAEAEIRAGETALRQLYEITSDARLDFSDKVNRLLDLMADRFGMGTGSLSRVTPEGFEVLEVHAFDGIVRRGQVTAYDQALGAEVLRTGEVVSLPRISATRFRRHHARAHDGLNAFVGVPVVMAGQIFGVLAFSSPKARRTAFRPSDVEFLRLIARWVGGELERESIASDLAIANDELLHTARRAGDLAAEAQSASQAKSEFLAAMSHELRTPLHGIIGTIDLLLDQESSPTSRGRLDMLARSAERLLDTVNEVLDFSKVEAGRIDLERADVDVRSLLGEVVALHAATAADRGLVLDLELDGSIPPLVALDPGRVTQVVGNLVGNAVKFTAGGGIRLRAGYADGALVVEVIDTGIGMDETTVRSLFRPFFQADASTARRYGGTGLGLAIAHGLVRAMGGDLSAFSKLGEGTRMVLVLPPLSDDVRVADRRPIMAINRVTDRRAGLAGGALTGAAGGSSLHVLRAPEHEPAARSGPPRVLVVDDDPAGRTIAVTMLVAMGCVVETASDGGEAVTRLLTADPAEVPELVLMDLHLPGRDGWTATREIRARASGRAATVPIVAVSADAFEDSRRRCTEAGMDGHLAKPFRAVDLRRIVALWCGLPEEPRTAPTGGGQPGTSPVPGFAFRSAAMLTTHAFTGAGSDVHVPGVGIRVLGPEAVADMPAVIREALESGGPRRALEFASLLLESSDEAVAGVLAALAEGRVADAGELAHRLRGSAAAFGADDLAIVARTIEHAADTRRSSTYLARLSDRLRMEHATARERLIDIRDRLTVEAVV